MFIDEHFADPVMRFPAVLFCVCTTNFSINGGKAVIVHVLDRAVEQTVTFFWLVIVCPLCPPLIPSFCPVRVSLECDLWTTYRYWFSFALIFHSIRKRYEGNLKSSEEKITLTVYI